MATTVEPLYCKQTDIPKSPKAEFVRPLELCEAMAKSIGSSNVDGAQPIRGLWRLYTKSKEARVELLIKGIHLRGLSVPLYETNPFSTNTNDPNDKREKILIKDLPLSVDNTCIEDFLGEFSHVQVQTDIRYSRERKDDYLTNYRNGDRYLYATAPIYPVLKQNAKIAGFSCRVLHPSQREVCKVCHNQGHNAKDVTCPAYNPKQNVIPFRINSAWPQLSNYYEYDLQYNGGSFTSNEHAFHYVKAMDLGKSDVANQIKDTKSPHEAREIASKQLPRDKVSKWNKSKAKEVMFDLQEQKFEQCSEFRDMLMNSEDAILVEATRDEYWGCGMLPDLAAVTDPEYWPGQSVLGSILMTLRHRKRVEIEYPTIHELASTSKTRPSDEDLLAEWGDDHSVGATDTKEEEDLLTPGQKPKGTSQSQHSIDTEAQDEYVNLLFSNNLDLTDVDGNDERPNDAIDNHDNTLTEHDDQEFSVHGNEGKDIHDDTLTDIKSVASPNTVQHTGDEELTPRQLQKQQDKEPEKKRKKSRRKSKGNSQGPMDNFVVQKANDKKRKYTGSPGSPKVHDSVKQVKSFHSSEDDYESDFSEISISGVSSASENQYKSDSVT